MFEWIKKIEKEDVKTSIHKVSKKYWAHVADDAARVAKNYEEVIPDNVAKAISKLPPWDPDLDAVEHIIKKMKKEQRNKTVFENKEINISKDNIFFSGGKNNEKRL